MRFVAGMLLCVVAACQPQQQAAQPPAAMSVEQAKQVTAAFKGQGFVPPPRTIADITAVLDQHKPDEAKVARDRAAADRQPAEGLAGPEAARFYYDRGLAALELGRLPQELADFRRAVAFAPSGTSETSVIRERLQSAEFRSGNLGTAIQIAEDRAGKERTGTRGMDIATFWQLVSYNVARGSLDDAERWLAQAQRLNAEAQTWNAGPVQSMWRYFVASSEAHLLLARGHADQAATRLRAGIVDVEAGLATYEQWTVQGRNQVSRETVQTIRDAAIKQLAAALREQGRLVEAEIEGRRALTSTLGRVGRYNVQTADRLDDLARTILDQGRFADAERLARAALDIGVTVEARGSWTMAGAREALSSALVAQARWAEALANNQEMMRELGDDPLSRQRFGTGNLDWATALIETGRGQEAVAMTERVLDGRRKSLGETHYATAEARAVQAMALAASGDRARALRAYQAALPILLEGAPRSTAETATARGQRLRLILDAYVRLLVEIRNTPVETEARIDATAEAFRLADAARGQAVQQALAAAGARATVTDPALADLARREQDASQQQAALEGVLTNALAAPADQQDARAIETLRNGIDRLRQARTALVREIEQRFPDYAALINPQPATLERARQALRPGEALVATYVSADATFVWAVPQQGPVAFARAPLRAVELGETVTRLRRSLDPRPQSIGDIPVFDVALANRLYQQLLQPVEPAWKGAASLLVVADGALAQLPLGVLVTEPKPAPAEAAGQALFAGYKQVPWLARRVAITQLPSVAALASLRALPAATGARKPFVGFGDPWFSAQQATQVAELSAGETATRGGGRIRFRSAPATATLDSADLATLPRLPDTADEVRDIARALKADPDRDVFVGAAANERTVKTMALADRRVIAFATHGLVPGDLNGLTEPALALSAPQVANVDGDGLLTMDEVLGLKLNADWVVLSACNTAAGDGVGAEAVSGLGRAFFYAGARALLVSNWPVETTSARALTTDVFRRQADRPDLTRADALRQAELALIDSDGLIDPATQKVAFSYAHPIFWAPFSLIGDGGAAK